MKTIFLVINEGFSARILLRSKFLNKISFKNKIVILSPNINEKYFKKEFSEKNVCFEEYNFSRYQKNFFQRTFHNLRLFSFTTDNTFTSYWLSNFIKKKNLFFILFFIPLQFLYSNSFSFRKFLNFIANLTSPKKYDFLFKKHKPDFLIVTSLGNLSNDCFIMNEAKNNKTKIISFILSWDNPTTKGMYSIKPDYVIAWNKIMFHELSQFHKIEKNKIFVIGTVQYENYLNNIFFEKKKIKKIFNLDSKKKTALVCLESPTSFEDNKKIFKILLKYLNYNQNIQFIVRPHPLSYRARNSKYIFEDELKIYKRYSKMHKDIKFDFIKINSMQLSFDMPKFEEQKLGGLLNYVDFVMCFYSSMMLEASIFKKPVINMSFCKRTTIPNNILSKLRHNHRVLKYGYIYDAKNINQLFDKINKCLIYPNRNILGLNKLLRNEISFIKHSSDKAIDVINKLK